jgi:hypothetical protein
MSAGALVLVWAAVIALPAGAGQAAGGLKGEAAMATQGAGGEGHRTDSTPDYAELRALAGHDHHPHDPFSLTMQAAARALGRDADYGRIYALSTNCFAPDIRPDEECRITWRMRGRGQCLELVAGALGLGVRPIGSYCPRRYGLRDSYPWAEKAREAAEEVRAALDAGEVVITDSGWMHDFMLWGVVTGVSQDGVMRGITPNGRTDNAFDHVCSLWALSPAEPALTERQADVLMLKRAVARIRADAEPFLPDSLSCGLPAVGAPAVPDAVVWGLPAMDQWIEQMEQIPYQQDDAGSSAGNARLCAWHTLHGAEVAADQLAAPAERLGDEAGPALRSAARHYGRIAALLQPAVRGRGDGGYEAIMGDPERQRAHAGVLRQVKAELTAAADDMAAALRSEGVALPGPGPQQEGDSATGAGPAGRP